MSGAFRKLLGPTSGRLKKYLDETPDYQVQIQNNFSDAQNFAALSGMKTQIIIDLEKLTRTIDLIDRTHREWVNFINGLDDPATEQAIYDDFIPDNDEESILTLLDDARELENILSAKNREIDRLLLLVDPAVLRRHSPRPHSQASSRRDEEETQGEDQDELGRGGSPPLPEPILPAPAAPAAPVPAAPAVIYEAPAAPAPARAVPAAAHAPAAARVPTALPAHAVPQPAFAPNAMMPGYGFQPWSLHLQGGSKRKYDGNPQRWPEFDENFEVCVHSQPIPDIVKFQILLDWLDGEALAALRGLAITAANYPLAREILRRRFGNPLLVRNALHAKIRNLRPAGDSTKDLRRTLEIMEGACRQLELAEEDMNHPQLGMVLESKFPTLLPAIYKVKADQPHWTVRDLRDFLNAQILRRETVEQLQHDYAKPKEEKHRGPERTSDSKPIHNTFSGVRNSPNGNRPQPKSPCGFCGGTHLHASCPKHTEPYSRRKVISSKKGCFICFSTDHYATECTRKGCSKCGKLHNVLLCLDGETKRPPRQDSAAKKDLSKKPMPPRPAPPSNVRRANAVISAPVPTDPPINANPANNAHEAQPIVQPPAIFTAFTNKLGHSSVDQLAVAAIPTVTGFNNQQSILGTLKATVRNPYQTDNFQVVDVFVDCGSEGSYVLSSLHEDLDLPALGSEEISLYTFGKQQPTAIQSSVVELEIVQNDDTAARLYTNTIEFLTPSLLSIPPTERNQLALKSNEAVDYETVSPSILIGVDKFWKFFLKSTPLGLDYFKIDLTFGSMICGGPSIQGRVGPRFSHFYPAISSKPHQADQDESPDHFDQFWNLEGIGIHDCPNTNEDQLVMNRFVETVQLREGRYEVRLPWKDNHDALPTNFGLAFSRLKNEYSKMAARKDIDLIAKYNEIFEEQLSLGIIEDVPPNPTGNICHYLSHFAVTNPNKPGKVRQVYDGSANLCNKPSLNDCLHKGPLILADLAGLWIRFRTLKNVIVADIIKAFLNVAIALADRDACRFLWLKNPRLPPTYENLRVLRFRRVLFGLICSPFLLAAVLQVHLSDPDTPQDEWERELCQKILENLYVDNMLLDAEDVDEVKRIYHTIQRLFEKAGMRCQEFASNLQEANEFFTANGCPVPSLQRVLGINWDIVNDRISFSLPSPKPENLLTKRQVLKIIAKIFDPTGLLCPVTVKGKIFFQTLWKNTYDWDQKLSIEEEEQWRNMTVDWTQTLFQFNRIALPLKPTDVVNLHICVDASAAAYAACIYVSHNSRTALIFSKNRLVPVKRPMTIPKLELMAVVLGVRLAAFVEKQLRCKIGSKTLWSDNQAVLHWILSRKDQKRFIKNRLVEIWSHPNIQFRYIPTGSNPSDLATRGLSIAEFSAAPIKSLWFHGPPFLANPENYPENIIIPPKDDPDTPVLKPVIMHSAAVIKRAKEKSDTPKEGNFDASRISSYTMLLNVVCFVLRFCSKKLPAPKRVSVKGKFSASDYNIAERVLIRQAQEQYPPTDLQIQQLQIFEDDYGLLRCQGRLEHAGLPPEAIYPIFLPDKSSITRAIIAQCHQKMHGSIHTTLATLRDKYWVPHGRRTVKSVIRKCQRCRRYDAHPYRLPPFASLPPERVNRSPPFTFTGIDYIGPIKVKDITGTVKIWVALFVCLSTRAIHLEYVKELTATMFINAFRRFASRRGTPQVLYSDNATTFKPSEKVIQDAWSTMVQDEETVSYFAKERISWKWGIPEAPWQNGHFEILVALVKNALRRSIGASQLTIEAFITLLAEAEALVNCRPITYLYDQFNNCRALRPCDFLHPNLEAGVSPLTDHGDPDYVDRPTPRDNLLRLWKQATKCLDRFWDTWVNEYLKSLRERYKRTFDNPRSASQHVPKVNDVVLLGDGDLPRGSWKLARVIEVIVSKDGLIRSAVIQLPNKTQLRRPISSLYPLEIPDKNDVVLQQKVTFTRLAQPKAMHILSLACVVILLANPAIALDQYACNLNSPATRVHTQTCVPKGIAIMETVEQTFCWSQISCPTGHIRPIASNDNATSYCGPKCPCVSWSDKCSQYTGYEAGVSTARNQTIIDAISKEYPLIICSLKPSKECDSVPTLGMFSQIMLFDLTIHLVSELQIQNVEAREEDLVCIGNSTSTHIGGTSRYCLRHKCSGLAKSFCYYPQDTYFVLLLKEVSFPIKAYGTIPITYYGYSHPTHSDCKACELQCRRGGIQLELDKSIHRLEICTDLNSCFVVKNPKTKSEINFPAETLLNPYQVSIRGWTEDGSFTFSKVASCPPMPFCEMITCSICWIRVANPQCIPRETLILILACLYVAAVILYYTALALYHVWPVIKEPLLWVGGLIIIAWNQMIRSVRYLRRQIRPAQIRRRRRVLPFIATLIVGLLKMGFSDACAEVSSMTASQETCSLSADGQLACTFQQTTVLTLLANHEVCLLLQDQDKISLGTLSLRNLHTGAKCKKENLYFSRNAAINTESSKRCPYAGSCDPTKCRNIQLNDKLEEFSNSSNEAPGHTYCYELGEGFKIPFTCDGCFVCHKPACLFFRNFAVPTSPTIFELFRCGLWEPEVKILLSINTPDLHEEHTFILHLGQTTAYNHIKLTLNSATLPPAPTMASTFITDGARYSLVHGVSPRGHPTPGLVGTLQCASRDKAQAFDCFFPPSACSCSPGYSRPHCTCVEMDHEKFFSDSQTALPIEQEGLLLRAVDHDIEALFQSSSTIQLQLIVAGLRLTTKVDSTTCEITSLDVSGCYNCLSGAKVHVTCKTRFGSALAQVDCGKHNFVVPCNHAGQASTVTVHFDKATLDESCEVKCPGGANKVKLKGTLAFINAPIYGNYSNVKVHENDPGTTSPWGNLPDIDFFALISFLTSRWMHIALIIVVIFLVWLTIRMAPYLINFVLAFVPQWRLLRLTARFAGHPHRL